MADKGRLHDPYWEGDDLSFSELVPRSDHQLVLYADNPTLKGWLRRSQVDFKSLVQGGARSDPLGSPKEKDFNFLLRGVHSPTINAFVVHHKPEFEVSDSFLAFRVVANYFDVCSLTPDETISFKTHSGQAAGCSHAADFGDHLQALWIWRAWSRVTNVNRFAPVK